MSNYSYIAVDPNGLETRGQLDVLDQSEALRRIKEMGLFPTKVLAAERRRPVMAQPARRGAGHWNVAITIPGLSGRVKTSALTVFTRQLSTLIENGVRRNDGSEFAAAVHPVYPRRQ